MTCLLLASVLCSLDLVHAPSAEQGKLWNQEIYLKSSMSSIPNYYDVSLKKPTSTTVKSIIINANSSGLWFIRQWISPQIPKDVSIEYEYNFLFAMYANTTGAGRLTGEFYLYRQGIETLLFSVGESNGITYLAACCHIWQYRISKQIDFLQGDRIAFKLSFNVSTAGLFKFFYDCSQFPSYLQDPTETRYMLKASWTQNGLTVKKLSLSSPSDTYQTMVKSAGRAVSNASWGIRVWNRTIASVETEMTSGTPVALVNRTANGGYSAQSNTWACPAANWLQASNCSLVTQWFCTFDNNGTWYNLQNSTTEGLGSSFLNASLWTITYYTRLISKETPVLAQAGLAYDGIEDSLQYYPTRIANIVYVSADYQAPYYYNVILNENTLASGYNQLWCNWTEIGSVKSTLSKYRSGHNNSGTFIYSIWMLASFGVTTENLTTTVLNNNTVGNIIAVKWECNDTSGNLNDTMPYQYYTITAAGSWHSLIWTFNLTGRRWNSVSWFVLLNARQWYHIPWFFILNARQWNNISWSFLLNARSWNSIVWNVLLNSSTWRSITWSFILNTQGWHSLIWVFRLNPFAIYRAFPFVWILTGFVAIVSLLFFPLVRTRLKNGKELIEEEEEWEDSD